jgi:hypothetical protein
MDVLLYERTRTAGAQLMKKKAKYDLERAPATAFGIIRCQKGQRFSKHTFSKGRRFSGIGAPIFTTTICFKP